MCRWTTNSIPWIHLRWHSAARVFNVWWTTTMFLLVVPESTYNSHVPLLLGTNLMKSTLDDVKQRFGPRYLQNVDLLTPWYMAFRCLSIRDKDLHRRNNRYAIVVCAEVKAIKIIDMTGEAVHDVLDEVSFPSHSAVTIILQCWIWRVVTIWTVGPLGF